jgi:hypothetical protein
MLTTIDGSGQGGSIQERCEREYCIRDGCLVARGARSCGIVVRKARSYINGSVTITRMGYMLLPGLVTYLDVHFLDGIQRSLNALFVPDIFPRIWCRLLATFGSAFTS